MIKYFLSVLAILIFSYMPSHATPVDRDTANKYYENCAVQSDPRFSEDTQKLFCACTAVKLMENYTIEDMQATTRQDASARDATNKMITEVYAPCIRYPAKEYHFQTCATDPKTKLLGNPQELCACSADKVAEHLHENAQNMLAAILRRDPNIMDPMQALYDDRSFQKVIQSKVMGCVIR
jgi:hypothetical protein